MTGARLPINMSQQITLRVRPGETVRFPSLCVNCGQPAAERTRLSRRQGQLTRTLDAPLCADCRRQLDRRSGEEERLLRLGWLAGGLVFIALDVLAILALSGFDWWLRLLVGLVLGVAGLILVLRLARGRAAAAALPETKAVRDAARIAGFDWRAMTFELKNDRVADEIRALNESRLATESAEPLAENTEPLTEEHE